MTKILNGHKFSSVHATDTVQAALRCIWGVLSIGIIFVSFEQSFALPEKKLLFTRVMTSHYVMYYTFFADRMWRAARVTGIRFATA